MPWKLWGKGKGWMANEQAVWTLGKPTPLRASTYFSLHVVATYAGYLGAASIDE